MVATVPATSTRSAATVSRVVLLFLVVSAFLFAVVGLRKSLPYAPEVDEPHLVNPSVRVASTYDFNPRWFAAPGSTIIYPLAAIIRVQDAIQFGSPLLGPDPELAARHKADPAPYQLLGRLLSVAYWVATIPLLYLVGRRVFGEPAALIGTWFATIIPIVVAYAQIARSDIPSLFFQMLAIWLCLRLYDRPSARRQALAGFAIGLGISTRYFMAAVGPVLVVADALILWRQRASWRSRRLWLEFALGLCLVLVGFALTSPYFFLDFEQANRNLIYEARNTHVGADGLSRPQNFLWYLTRALPEVLTWPLAALSALGLAMSLRQRQPAHLLLLVYTAVFLLGISYLGLHWHRWLVALLPILALFAAWALVECWRWASKRLRFSRGRLASALAAAVLIVSIQPLYQLVIFDIQQAQPSTRLQARDWLIANAPPNSRIFWEGYNDVLDRTGFRVTIRPTFIPGSYTRLIGSYDYLVTTSAISEPYLAEPERYSGPVEKYTELYSKGPLAAEFRPLSAVIGDLPILGRAECYCTVAPIRGDPTIRIYDLRSVAAIDGPSRSARSPG